MEYIGNFEQYASGGTGSSIRQIIGHPNNFYGKSSAMIGSPLQPDGDNSKEPAEFEIFT